jgi:hypothetical protein
VEDIAEPAKRPCQYSDVVGDEVEILGSELPDSVVWVRLDRNREGDLTLKFLDLAEVFALGVGVVKEGNIVDSKAGLDEDIFSLRSIGDGIVTNKHSARLLMLEGDCMQEASELETVSMMDDG